MLIYAGQPIRTTLDYTNTIYDGVFIHTLPNGAIAATLLDDDYQFGVTLDADEWVLVTDDPLAHDERFVR